MARKSTLAAAFDAAGFRSSRARLDAIADQVVSASGWKTRDAMIQAVVAQVINDAGLLWALFEPHANSRIGVLLEDANQRRIARNATKPRTSSGASADADTKHLPPQTAGGRKAPGPSPAERRKAQADNATKLVAGIIKSKLDTFKINGRPIGDCTPEEGMAWYSSHQRDGRFVWLLCNSGVPAGHRFRDYLKPQEADAMYARAVEHAGNE